MVSDRSCLLSCPLLLAALRSGYCSSRTGKWIKAGAKRTVSSFRVDSNNTKTDRLTSCITKLFSFTVEQVLLSQVRAYVFDLYFDAAIGLIPVLHFYPAEGIQCTHSALWLRAVRSQGIIETAE